MKTIASLILVLIATGCGNLGHQATLASTETFQQIFADQLRQSGKVEDLGNGGGGGENIRTKDFAYSISVTNFPPERLYPVAQEALKKWGHLYDYNTSGTGGGQNHFEMSYGSGRTQAFIDIIAYRDGDRTHIDFLVRVVE